MGEFFNDPRRRNLAILAGAALLSIILAVLALNAQQSDETAHYTPHYFFPNIGNHTRDVARIHIASRHGAFDVEFKPYKGWVIPSHDDFPASFAQQQQTLHGFSSLIVLEPKTARADWLHYVNLDAPPKGNGVEITLYDDKGNAMAGLIVGKGADINDPTGDSGMFVRKPDSTQSWLAKSPFVFKSDASDWMDKNVVSVDRSRIVEADIDPTGAPSFEVRHEPGAADFTVLDLPKGRELADPTAPDGVATAVAAFTFDDARPAKDFDFGDAARVITKTSDGLTVTVETLKQGNDYWATVAAESAPGSPDAAREAAVINVHANGWAYKLPQAEGQLFMTTLDSLLKPAGTPAPKK